MMLRLRTFSKILCSRHRQSSPYNAPTVAIDTLLIQSWRIDELMITISSRADNHKCEFNHSLAIMTLRLRTVSNRPSLHLVHAYYTKPSPSVKYRHHGNLHWWFCRHNHHVSLELLWAFFTTIEEQSLSYCSLYATTRHGVSSLPIPRLLQHHVSMV